MYMGIERQKLLKSFKLAVYLVADKWRLVSWVEGARACILREGMFTSKTASLAKFRLPRRPVPKVISRFFSSERSRIQAHKIFFFQSATFLAFLLQNLSFLGNSINANDFFV
jgi:hypothetical protein